MHLNNAVVSPPIAPQMGLPHAHSNRLQMTSTMPHQAPDYAKYATLKAVGMCYRSPGTGQGCITSLCFLWLCFSSSLPASRGSSDCDFPKARGKETGHPWCCQGEQCSPQL